MLTALLNIYRILSKMSFKVAVGKSQKKDLLEAVREATFACLAQIPEPQEINLAIVFSAPAFANTSLLKNIKLILKADLALIGCSAMNLITAEGAQKEGLVLILLAIPKVKISCAFSQLSRDKDALVSGQELGAGLISGVKGQHRQLCLIFSDGLSENTSVLIKGLQNTLGRSFPFIGGGASDNLKFEQTFQFYNEDVLNKGAVAALFSGKLNYGIGIRHGWKPLGKIRTITESKSNVIKKIDGKKASGLYEDYFAKTLPELRKEILHINILYPIGVYLQGENEYLLRNVISLNQDGSITTHGDVPQGSSIRLMAGNKETCLEAARQAALQVKTALRGKMADSVIVISSTSRARLLGRDMGREIKVIKEILGEDTPLAGFYSYGEYAPLGSLNYSGQTYLHNQTIAILGLGWGE